MAQLSQHTDAEAPAESSWRAFGRVEDLDHDFRADDRPALVTSILAACAEPPMQVEAAWDMTLSERIAGLLRILVASQSLAHLDLTLRCPVQACGEPMDVELSIEALIALAVEARQTNETEYKGRTLRRPRGRDLQRWRRAGFASREEAEAEVLASLVVGGPVRAQDRKTLAGKLAEFDPLAAFDVSVSCPECSADVDIHVDLEGVALRRLATAQEQMIRDVDRLARRYGWTESEILSIPLARRQRYLALDGDGWP